MSASLLDIDCFCILNEIPVHIASNGMALPKNLYSAKELESIALEVLNLPLAKSVSFNVPYVKSLRPKYDYVSNCKSLEDDFLYPKFVEKNEFPKDFEAADVAYTWSFAEFAKRGFYSYDCVGENECRLVAFPENKFSNNLHLPDKIFSMLRHLKISNLKVGEGKIDFNGMIDEVLNGVGNY